MLIDDLKELLKSIDPEIETIKKFWQNSGFEEEYKNLHNQVHQETFWQHPERVTITQRFEHLKEQQDAYHKIIKNYAEFGELINLFAQDEDELKRIEPELAAFARSVKKFKILLLLSGPDDQSNCFLSINAGAGGTESQDWAEILLRMYTRFCENQKFNAQLVDYQPGEGAGIKSATIVIGGKNAYGLLKSEHGVHRLVRISPFDANKRRHTSFASVSLIPEYKDTGEIIIDPKDLRIDTYRSGGAGGQHVNKTDSAVRITHIPTGTVVQCQSERSQIQNRAAAMRILQAKLLELKRKEQEDELWEIRGEQQDIAWGSQIRSYVFHPYSLVKDHRTNVETGNVTAVMDGEIDLFIAAFLQQNKSER